MRSSGAAIVMVVAFVVLFAALTGRLDCFVNLWKCITSGDTTETVSTPGVGGGTNW